MFDEDATPSILKDATPTILMDATPTICFYLSAGPATGSSGATALLPWSRDHITVRVKVDGFMH